MYCYMMQPNTNIFYKTDDFYLYKISTSIRLGKKEGLLYQCNYCSMDNIVTKLRA